MIRLVKNLTISSCLCQSSAIHDIYAVTKAGNDTKIMGDHDDSCSCLSAHFLNQFKHLCLNRNIKRSRWLIGNNKLWLICQCNCNHDTLSHTARKFKRILIDTLFWRWNTDLTHQLNCTFICFFLCHFRIVIQKSLTNLLSNS